MVWNIAPECISAIVLSIVWIYSRKGNIAPTLKNKLFQLCFLATFLAMTSNIISTILIYYLNEITIYPAWIINSIYFIATPLMGTVYYMYLMANVYEEHKLPKILFRTLLIPALLYIILVLINPWTHAIYSLSLEHGYQQGPWISVTYIIFYLYCIICFVMVVLRAKYLDKTVSAILFSFPLIAALVIVVQLFEPSIILSGSAATIALLMIYLYMQNKQIAIDYLTKLPNRQEFLNLLEIRVRDHKRPFTIVVVSLREFKRINDVYGQHAGDRFLYAVSDFLKTEFKLSERELFRYSGDEYALLLDQSQKETVEDVLHRIQERMLQPWNGDGCTCILYASMGVVEFPECVDTVEQIINGIEFSVNLAKKDTLHKHTCYCTKDMLDKVKRRQQIADILRDCLQNKTFAVYYQPIYTIHKRNFFGAEALLRIPESVLGPIYPDEFIPVAEESGLIVDITYMVLDEVCHVIQEMKQKHIPIETINVNFSTLQFIQPDLMEKVIAILKEHDVEGSMVKIEITESTLAENADVMLDYVKQIKSYGIKFSLDDFGTGYSNISTVLKIPFDTVKLDKSLIWGAMENEHSAIAMQSLTQTFDNLGMEVLAEGVETQLQSEFVEACGCALIQGFLYARPMPKEDFISFMKQHL